MKKKQFLWAGAIALFIGWRVLVHIENRRVEREAQALANSLQLLTDYARSAPVPALQEIQTYHDPFEDVRRARAERTFYYDRDGRYVGSSSKLPSTEP